MLRISDSVEFSRTSAAGGLMLGALCPVVANVVDPAWARDEEAWLEQAATDATQHVAESCASVLGPVLVAVGLWSRR